MKTPLRGFVVCLLLGGPVAFAAANDNLQQVLSRMDKAAADFKAMTAQVTYVTHTDVLNDNSTETGTAIMKKVQPGEVQAPIQFYPPRPPNNSTFINSG